MAQERSAFLVVPGGGHHRDVQPLDLLDLVVIDLRKNDLFTNSQRIVAAPIEGLSGNPPEVPDPGQGALGISMGPALIPSGSAIQSIRYGSLAVYEQTRLLVLLPGQMIRGQVSPENSRFVGLKGIYDLFGQAVSRDVQSREPTSAAPASQVPTWFTLQLIGVLTISLGVLNLFPFPALDGGRIFFVLPELILRRRVPPEWENGINAVGMALLLAFMVYVNVMDFVNPAIVTLPK